MHTRSSPVSSSIVTCAAATTPTMVPCTTPRRTRRTRTTTTMNTPQQQTVLRGSITKTKKKTTQVSLSTSKKHTKHATLTPFITIPSSPTHSSDSVSTTLTDTPTVSSSSPLSCSLPPKRLDFDIQPIAPAKILEESTPQLEEEKEEDEVKPPVGREEQYNQLFTMLQASLSSDEPSRPVYICGTPGTGKTMTVKNVLKRLQQVQQGGHDHEQVFFNCASVSSSNELLKLLEGRNVHHDSKPVLIIIDEIDLLISKSSKVTCTALYKLFDMCSHSSHLSLLVIANAIDIPTRLLPYLSNNVQTKPKTIVFQPYTCDTLLRIAQDLVKDSHDVNIPKLALTLASKKVAAAGGDARLMINVMKQTLNQLKLTQNKKNILSLMLSIINQKASNCSNNIINTIQHLPIHQQIACIVAANAKAASISAKGRQKRANLLGLYQSFKRMCQRVNVPAVQWDEFTAFVTGSLAQQAILDVGKANIIGSKPVALRVSVDDVRKGIEQRPLLQTLLI